MAKHIVIVYHGECRDGFGGAWAAWKKFGSKAHYIPYRHGDVPKINISNAEVYFIDLVYPFAELKTMRAKNNRIIIIDHHQSNANKIAFADESLYTMEHSGSVLAWRYFHPKKKPPKFLLFIEDTDLGHWKLPHTKEAFAYISAHPYNFKKWNTLAKTFHQPALQRKALAEGKLLLNCEKQITEQIATDAEVVEFEGYKCLAANSPILVTSIGTELARRMPPISIVWSKRAGYYRVSLRSVGDIDVAKIAQKYGGGGHKNAAGFTIRQGDPFPWRAIATTASSSLNI